MLGFRAIPPENQKIYVKLKIRMICIYNSPMLKPAHPTLPVQQAGAVDAAPAAAALGNRRISSADLLGQQRMVEIAHQGQIYQLRVTAAGKLILTK
jgi:hemin uptake protein HemP